MRRYTLNQRGRVIFIETPVVLAIVILSATNAIDLFVAWIFS